MGDGEGGGKNCWGEDRLKDVLYSTGNAANILLMERNLSKLYKTTDTIH